MMYVVDSRNFRPTIRKCLRRVRKGDHVVLVVHGRPVALLRPVRPGDEGLLVPSRLLRDELHDTIQKARYGCLVVTWYGRAYAVLEAPAPEVRELFEEAS